MDTGSSRLSGSREGQCKHAALSRLACQLQPGTQIGRPMLDDGEAQARAAAGVTLVHPVKPLEDPALRLRRDADAGVRHGDPAALQAVRQGDADAAAGAVIGDGVVPEVVDDLLHDLRHRLDGITVPLHLYCHLLCRCRLGQLALHAVRHLPQGDRLPLGRGDCDFTDVIITQDSFGFNNSPLPICGSI